MERVGIDVRVQGRQAAEQDISRIGAELQGLGADTRDLAGDSDRLAADFDASMRDLLEAIGRTRTGAGTDLDLLGQDLRDLGDDAGAGVNDALGELDRLRREMDDLRRGGGSGPGDDGGGGGDEDGGGFTFLGAGGRAGLIGGALALGALAGEAVMEGMEQELSADIVAARLGLFDPALQAELEALTSGIFTAAYGDSYEDVLGAIQDVYEAARPLGETLGTIEEDVIGVLGLETLTGADSSEIARGVTALARLMDDDLAGALDATYEAVNRGAGLQGDLFDVLAEYGNIVGDGGLAGETFLGALVAGAEEGVFQLDFVADGMKEMGVLLTEGSADVREALQSMGLDDDQIIRDFAEGGETARQAMEDVVAGIDGIEDALARRQTLQTLGAGPFENIGFDTALEVISNAGTALDDFNGSMDDTIAIMDDNDITRFTAEWRELRQTFVDFADGSPAEIIADTAAIALAGVNEIFELFDDGLDPTSPMGRFWSVARDGWTDISNAIGDARDVLGGYHDDLVDILGLGSPDITGTVGTGTAPGGYIGGKEPEIDLNPWGGGGAATFQPSTHAPTVEHHYYINAVDAPSFRDLVSRERGMIAEEVAVAIGRAGVME